MSCCCSAHIGSTADQNVPRQENVVAQDHVILDVAIVCHVATGHKQAVVADSRYAAPLDGSSIYRNELTNGVSVADLQASALPLVRKILGRTT
jgi:hypothetical protein